MVHPSSSSARFFAQSVDVADGRISPSLEPTRISVEPLAFGIDEDNLENGDGVLHSGPELKLVRLLGQPAGYTVLDTIKASDSGVGVTVNDFSTHWPRVKDNANLQILTRIENGGNSFSRLALPSSSARPFLTPV
jgi:hypothetical protein